MSDEQRNTLIPLVGTLVGIVVWLIVVLLFVFDGEQYGTVAEWIGALGAILIGTVAAVFAALAWNEARHANTWAAKAVAAEKRTQYLMELGIASSVTFIFREKEVRNAPSRRLHYLELAVADDTPRVWIRSVEASLTAGWAPDGPPKQVVLWQNALEYACSLLRNRYIGPGSPADTIWIEDSREAVDPHDAEVFIAKVRVKYAVTDDDDAWEFTSPEISLQLLRQEVADSQGYVHPSKQPQS